MFYSTRARKKKALTDPVEIIPFPGQNLRDIAPKPQPKANIPLKVERYSTKIEAKVLTVPTGQLNTTNISIKKSMEVREESDNNSSQLVSQNLPKESFSVDQIKMAWRKFAFETKSKGMETFYNAMVKRDPKVIDDTILVMSVDNQIQIDYITPHLQDLNGFLRAELKNYDVSVELKLGENQDTEVKYLTGKDKFAAMARKNPNLHSLKTIFNLDIEY